MSTPSPPHSVTSIESLSSNIDWFNFTNTELNKIENGLWRALEEPRDTLDSNLQNLQSMFGTSTITRRESYILWRNSPMLDTNKKDDRQYQDKYDWCPLIFKHAENGYFEHIRKFSNRYCKTKLHTLYRKLEAESSNIPKAERIPVKQLVRTLRHFHTDNMRKLISMYHHKALTQTDRRTELKKLMEEEIATPESNKWDKPIWDYFLQHSALFNAVDDGLLELAKDNNIYLMEWCGDWISQLMFWVYNRSPLYDMWSMDSVECGKDVFTSAVDKYLTSLGNNEEIYRELHTQIISLWAKDERVVATVATNPICDQINTFLTMRVVEFIVRRMAYLCVAEGATWNLVHFANT